MKTLRLIFFLLIFVNGKLLIGQINPINNLYYIQFYDLGNQNCPAFNCFELMWEPPDTTSDTLIGYKVYKNNQFYVFTLETVVACAGMTPCNYEDFYYNMPFWATVKGVYNSDSIESIADDSIYVGHLALSINELEHNEITLLRNPVPLGENISLQFPNSLSDVHNIKILTINGRTIKTYNFKPHHQSIVNLSTVGINKGTYMVIVEMRTEVFTKKVIIE